MNKTVHLVPVPGTALTGLGMTLRPGQLYRVTPEMAGRERDDQGQCWLDDLSDLGQRRRWGRKLLQVAEIEASRAGARKVVLRATTEAHLKGLGLMRTGDEITLTAELVAQLDWLRPAVQVASYGEQVFVADPSTEEVSAP